MSIESPLPPYTVAVYKHYPLYGNKELVAVKRIGGHWDVIGADFWFNSDEELFEEWPEVEIIGLGIWQGETGFNNV